MSKLKRYFAPTFVGITFLIGVACCAGIAIEISRSQTVFIEHLPSALLLVVLALAPSIEYWRIKRLRWRGITVRAGLVLAADALLSQGQDFISVYWEVAGVAIALIWVFYTPLLWRTLIHWKKSSA
ncbi:MAG: hypothetical protein AAF329_20575 [Cyanobacteria bacterium P01_A01_bin.17]